MSQQVWSTSDLSNISIVQCIKMRCFFCLDFVNACDVTLRRLWFFFIFYSDVPVFCAVCYAEVVFWCCNGQNGLFCPQSFVRRWLSEAGSVSEFLTTYTLLHDDQANWPVLLHFTFWRKPGANGQMVSKWKTVGGLSTSVTCPSFSGYSGRPGLSSWRVPKVFSVLQH